MSRQQKILAAKFAAVLWVIPVMIYAKADGPDPRKTGAPGDKLCTECHVGTANPPGGKVEVSFAGGLTYTPGAKQRLTVTVTDSPARGVNGFQLTARLASNESNGQAGAFTPLDSSTQVLCENDSQKQGPSCPATAPLEFIEHTQSGNQSNTWSFEWTPPASDVGNVRIYVAGNSANGNRQNTGDRIFSANYTLTPASAQAPQPAIRAQQPVLQAFSGTAGVSSGTWIEIYGTNLSPTTREWGGNDFSGSNAPTKLDGVGVNVNGKPAFVRYISPTQINVQAPDDDATGPVRIEVTGPNGTSDPVTVQKTKVSPALLTTPLFNVGGVQYLAALYPDFQTFVGRAGLIAGVA
ncbi:MAG: choice-of-anchor V domain-containing protein, partial [Acidobacteriota bacterium]